MHLGPLAEQRAVYGEQPGCVALRELRLGINLRRRLLRLRLHLRGANTTGTVEPECIRLGPGPGPCEQASEGALGAGRAHALRWPVAGSDLGKVQWRAADMSDNKWVLQFDIEYANFPDATFTKAGQLIGPGPKKNLSALDANRVYTFMTPFKLQGSNYYFRVCAGNDAGRQCGAPVLARKPTAGELASTLGGGARVGPGVIPLRGGNAPGAGGPSSGPIALGTGRPPGPPERLEVVRPAGHLRAASESRSRSRRSRWAAYVRLSRRLRRGSSGGVTPAGGPPPTSVGAGTPGKPSGGGGAPAGIVARRPIGPVAGSLQPGQSPERG